MNENYNLELKEIVKLISKKKAKRILIQLPDGLKSKVKEIQKFLEKHTNTEILFWSGSNFGACDLPLKAEKLGIDLILHYGHTEWR